ncbi:MAG TPA: class I SAM-dependent methyltransferase [Anaerolineales bacterium]|nr:class I SAM-dependent methyltransferase [Anaerolineales bacterium]
MMTKPESIENRWDILYRDYPEVYEAFSSTPYQPTIYEQLPAIVDLRGKVIADIGAGTGESSRSLAQYAKRVVGVEREMAMIQQATSSPERGPGKPAGYLAGDALALPLADGSVDIVTGLTLALYPPDRYRTFIREGMRVARGLVVYVGIPPGWYGGELFDVIEGFERVDDVVDRIFIDEFGFSHQDIESVQEYGTVDHIVSTYGFIFGRRVIEHLKKEGKTSIRWRFRVYWKA